VIEERFAGDKISSEFARDGKWAGTAGVERLIWCPAMKRRAPSVSCFYIVAAIGACDFIGPWHASHATDISAIAV